MMTENRTRQLIVFTFYLHCKSIAALFFLFHIVIRFKECVIPPIDRDNMKRLIKQNKAAVVFTSDLHCKAIAALVFFYSIRFQDSV